MAGLLDLAKRCEEIDGQAGELASQKAVNAALVMLHYLLFITPVDTSRALSNWQAGLGAPPRFFRPAIFQGRFGSTQEASANEAYAEAKAILARKKPGEPIYISNNAPYIGKLNEGSSRQHPGGFVEAAVRLGQASVRGDARIKQL